MLSIKKVAAGALATRAMTDAMDNAERFRLAPLDIASVLGSALNGWKCADKGSPAWKAGMAAHYALGSIVFPMAYDAMFKRTVPGGHVTKAVLWGVALYGVAQTMVMPSLKKGWYFKQHPTAAVTYFLGHLIYGYTFGTVSGKQAR